MLSPALPPVLLSHPTGNQNVRQAALALASAGLLAEFWTCLNWREGSAMESFLPASLLRTLGRRCFPAEVEPYVRTWAWRELARHLIARLPFAPGRVRKCFSPNAVAESLDRRVARRLPNGSFRAVYAYDHGACETFAAAASLGMWKIYEHPIAHWRAVRELQKSEAEMHPAWKPTFAGLQDDDDTLARKDRELELADVIVVPSSFSSESLRNVPGITAPIHVLPYGGPPVSKTEPHSRSAGALKVLFVGSLSQAKGLNYLLGAVGRMGGRVELTLVGRRVCPGIPDDRTLGRHRWVPTLAHDAILELMREHDVLVHPSLHEGFGLVLLEALSQGLPVIATNHTAAPDLIDDGKAGFIIPIRSADAIVEKLELLLCDPELLRAMSAAALACAREHSWPQYRSRLAAFVGGELARHTNS